MDLVVSYFPTNPCGLVKSSALEWLQDVVDGAFSGGVSIGFMLGRSVDFGHVQMICGFA